MLLSLVNEPNSATESFPHGLCPQMVLYSLGMTLYWCVDYHLPQNQVPFAIFHPQLIPWHALRDFLHSHLLCCYLFLHSRSSWVQSWRVCCSACARTRCWGVQTCWRCWRPASFTTRPPCCLPPRGWSGSWWRTSTETLWAFDGLRFSSATRSLMCFVVMPQPIGRFMKLVMMLISLQVDHMSLAENGPQLTDRSQMVRDRLHSETWICFVDQLFFSHVFKIKQ